MVLKRSIASVTEFLRTHERPLGALVFVGGFVTDILTFNLLPLPAIVALFSAYAVLAAVASFGTHALARFANTGAPWLRALSALSPLALLYASGGILSGLIVFYTVHSALIVSWPFIALLGLVYFGNEYFRKHKEHLVFQTILFFFSLYAYAVFAFPILLNALGPLVFLASSVFAVVAFALFLLLLKRVDRGRYAENAWPVRLAALVVVLIVNAAYFTGLVPPVPLALVDSGIAHSIVKAGGSYTATVEAKQSWWDIRTQAAHLPPGSPVFVWSAVSAPVRLSTDVVHLWEYRTPDGDWVKRSQIFFSIAGGRPEGYRIYSEEVNPVPGAWRVTVKTAAGQVIGRIRFDIESAGTEPALTSKTL